MSDTINHTLRSTAWARKSLAALILLGMNAVLAPSAFALSNYVPANQPVGYVAQERTSSQTLASGNETLYRSEYQRTDWSGNVFAFPISANASVNIGAERWGGEGAQAVIDAQNYSTGRFIATMKDDGTAIPFLYASLSATQQALFPTATIGSTSYTGTQVVDFLRGDRTNESASGMRIRGTVLGDIIHSRLLIVNDATNPTVLVGANDGMLHAINTADGTERWAYVPSMLLSKMKNLAANPYTHDYYVDGQITVGTVNISGTDKRVLVGGLGAGGKGLYALDITDLSASSDSEVASKVLWEITPTTVNYATPQIYPSTVSASAYQNLGYTYGIPYIRKINNGGTTQTVVIIGNGVNTGGDYQAYLLVIDAATGKLVRSILADTGATTDGTAANPNGLFNPVPIDTDGNGTVDRVYAGDLNGTLWKFDLSSTNVASWSASVLHTTSPAQPITATLDATTHPNGGYMVTFATGSLLTGTYPQYTCTGQPASLAGCTLDAAATGEVADTSVHYVYGIWDGAPVGNTTLKTQILQQRDYIYPPPPTVGGVETEVYRVNATAPNWASGGDKGWRVPLQICDLTGQPACADIGRNAGGARVIGEGAFISSGRYYVNVYEPTVPYLIPGTDSVVVGENKQLALYFENGGAKELFMDLSGNGTVGSEDRIQYISSDDEVVDGTHDVGESIFDPDQDGIAVGKWLSRGVSSQPLLVKLTTLYTTLFSQNPDISLPPAPELEQGVTGGHFDSDIYYGSSTSGAKATATIVVGTSGQTLGVAATLGGIAVDGIPIVGPLSTVDLANGTATTTNATMLKNKINEMTATSGYTATVSGSTVTVTAPFSGTTYNGKTFTVTDGSESLPATAATSAVAAVYASRTLTFTNSTSINPTGVSILVNGNEIMTATTPGSAMTSAQLASWVAANSSLTNYDITASGSTVTITSTIAANGIYDISSLTASADAVSASTIVSAPSYVAGVTAVTGTRPTGLITFANGPSSNSNPGAEIKDNLNGTAKDSIMVGTATAYGSKLTIGKNKSNTAAASAVVAAIGTTGTIKAYVGGNAITPTCAAATTSQVCLVDNGNYTNGKAVTTGTWHANGAPMTIATTATAGAVPAVTGTPASGSFTFTNTVAVNPTGFSVTVNGVNMMTSATPGVAKTSSELATWVAANSSKAGYTITASGSTVTITSNTIPGTDITSIVVAGSVPGISTTVGSAVAGVAAVAASPATGWVNWAPALTTGTFSGGSDGTVTGNTCTSTCGTKKHHHQYDDLFDVTGVNMLNSSDPAQNLSMAIPSASIDFKVLIHNQYLNPAARLHIGDSSYVYNIDHGYINVKDYQTSAGLDITTVPTYNRATIGSLAINLPTDALTTKNWWGNGDMRAGLHPTVTGCVNKAAGANDGNMYQPVIPPPNGTDGAGTAGWNTGTTPATATGVRHNGALTIQIIRATTPQTAIEENVAGRPEYGYRVKSANFADYVLAEYTLFWHFGPCYHATPTTQSLSVEFKFSGNKDLSGFSIKIDGAELLVSNNPPSVDKNGLVTWILANDTTLSGYTVTGSGAKITITKSDGTLPVVEVTADDLTGIEVKRSYTNWTKAPPADVSKCTPIEGATYCEEPAAGSTDPHIGDLSAGVAGDVADVESNTEGNVTTTVITYTDGTSATIVTTHNDDGTVTIVTTDATGTTTTQTVADTAGGSGTSGLLSGSTSGVGRISWRELIRK